MNIFISFIAGYFEPIRRIRAFCFNPFTLISRSHMDERLALIRENEPTDP